MYGKFLLYRVIHLNPCSKSIMAESGWEVAGLPPSCHAVFVVDKSFLWVVRFRFPAFVLPNAWRSPVIRGWFSEPTNRTPSRAFNLGCFSSSIRVARLGEPWIAPVDACKHLDLNVWWAKTRHISRRKGASLVSPPHVVRVFRTMEIRSSIFCAQWFTFYVQWDMKWM
jgi:hypothetical protein